VKELGCKKIKTEKQRRLSSRAQGGPLGKKCAALVNSGNNLVHDNIYWIRIHLQQERGAMRQREGERERERDTHAI
jgi:hypothetical protein